MILKRITQKKIVYLFCFSFLLVNVSFSQQRFATWTEKELTLNNGIVKRMIELPGANGNFLTKTYTPVAGGFNYFAKASADFQFEINGKKNIPGN